MKHFLKRTLLGIGYVVFWLAWPAYQVYFRRGARTRVLLVAGDKILITKGWIHDGTWNLSGGGLHKGEDPLDGAVREVGEETGLVLDPQTLQYLGTAVYHRAGLSFTYHMYFGTADDSSVLTAQRHEIAELVWVTMAAIKSIRLSQEAYHCLEVARSRGLLQYK